jgi:hypothetical protein
LQDASVRVMLVIDECVGGEIEVRYEWVGELMAEEVCTPLAWKDKVVEYTHSIDPLIQVVRLCTFPAKP